jgi:hypothetical protein
MNSIALASKLVPVLDAVYKEASLTAKLDGNPELAREGANAGELVIPKLDMQALGNYDRNSGYVDGDVTLTHETVQCNYERGRMFTVDVVDSSDSGGEGAGIAFSQLAGEFIRTKVVPEQDAFRFACYASTEGISKPVSGETLETGAAVVAALRVAINKMDEDEVPQSDRHLYITPTLYGLIEDLDTTKSKAVLANFASITKVPQTRFYTKIKLKSGKIVTPAGGGDPVDETAGGYVKAADGKNINFMIIHRPALIQYTKHVAPKIVTPEMNQNADAWKFGYRNVAIADIYENKLAGVYCSYAGE